jgi:hypothetical protein
MIARDLRLSCIITHDCWDSRLRAIHWCVNNLGNYKYAWFDDHINGVSYRYYFKNKHDLAWFKMVWL